MDLIFLCLLFTKFSDLKGIVEYECSELNKFGSAERKRFKQIISSNLVRLTLFFATRILSCNFFVTACSFAKSSSRESSLANRSQGKAKISQEWLLPA